MIICSEELSYFCVAGWVRETYRKPQKESCWWSFLSWPCWGKLFPAPTITKVSSVHLHCLCEMVPLSRVRYTVFTGLLSFVRCGLPLAIFIFFQWKCRELSSSWLWKEKRGVFRMTARCANIVQWMQNSVVPPLLRVAMLKCWLGV